LVIATKLFGTVVRNGEKTQGKSKKELAHMGYANQQGGWGKATVGPRLPFVMFLRC
jgi:hypothetical protein